MGRPAINTCNECITLIACIAYNERIARYERNSLITRKACNKPAYKSITFIWEGAAGTA